MEKHSIEPGRGILPETRYIEKGTPVVDPELSTSHVAPGFKSGKSFHKQQDI